MGWFGGDKEKPAEQSFSSDEGFTSGSSNDQIYGGGGGSQYSGGADGLREKAAQLQQAAGMNQVIQMYTTLAFDKCVTKPDSSLSSREISCIEAQVGKFQDFQQFVMERMKRKASGNM
ncbi:hypothetical protein ScalyP_jg8135 [Parmales sp. scaly parma]|nr:hypothetical protein ScalyP_jg8135 [Parmales sp. scaly parma]|tara:strand:+ start:71 stop:424 length:354 start_codon:yes stop_codon:yes gene_type:complete